MNERSHYNISYIQFLTALFILGMQLVVLASKPMFFFFAWEVMSFSSFLLVMSDMKTDSIRPALFYMIMTHLGAGAILAGFLAISGGNFDMNFAQMGSAAATLPFWNVIGIFALFFFGFGSKAGLFPFHGWLPEAHPQAPSHISALMSGVMLKIAVYGFLRVLLYVLPVMPVQIGFIVVIIGLFSAVFGVLYSVIETDIKRILAFSSIENLGLIFTMIGVAMVARSSNMESLVNVAIIAALFQSVVHSFFKSGLFLTAGVAAQTFHTRNIEKMGGMAKKMRIFSAAALLLCLTAAALPPSGSFITEWLLIQSIITNIASADFAVKALLLIVLIVVGLVAGIAVLSMVRFFGIGFLAEARSARDNVGEEPAKDMLLPVVLLGGMAFLMGAFALPILEIVSNGMLVGELKSQNAFPFSFNPFVLSLIMLGVVLLAAIMRRVSSDVRKERLYHTWDCGQPINETMEYTATAFSAPIRFFFRFVVQARKKIVSQPIVATNKWLAKKSITIDIYPVWDRYFYNPILNLAKWCSCTIRRLQNGNIQFYISLILISLIITAIVTL